MVVCVSVVCDAARCQILRPKCTKFAFRWGSAPDPCTAYSYSAPQTPSLYSRVPTSKGREGKGGNRPPPFFFERRRFPARELLNRRGSAARWLPGRSDVNFTRVRRFRDLCGHLKFFLATSFSTLYDVRAHIVLPILPQSIQLLDDGIVSLAALTLVISRESVENTVEMSASLQSLYTQGGSVAEWLAY